ncbi:MAG: hypothetical protein OHK0017_13530 [Patescibacteria group bacterium]
MELLLYVSLTINLIVLALVYFSIKRKNEVVDLDKIADKVALKLSETQLNFAGKLFDTQQEQTKSINTTINGLEQRFGEIQVKLNQTLTDEMYKVQQLQLQSLSETKAKLQEQIQEQKVQSQQIQLKNQESIVNLQTLIREQLSRAVQDLMHTNTQNFSVLAKANEDKLSIIQGEVEKKLGESLKQNLQSFNQINQNLGQMEAKASQMIEATKSIDKLNNIFARGGSKVVGDFGEKYLENMLDEHLNQRNWKKQASFDGSPEKIDFIVSLGDKQIGIDSKFPATRYQAYLEADITQKPKALKEFLTTVKEMATDISKKYIGPGKLETVLLYLPGDAMYIEVVNDNSTMESLTKLKVTPISPTTLFPIILTVLTYEHRLFVNEHAEEIIEGLKTIKKNILSFREEFRKLGTKIDQAKQNFETASRDLKGVEVTIESLESAEDKKTELTQTIIDLESIAAD